MYSTGVNRLCILVVSDGRSYFRPRSRSRPGQVHAVGNDDGARSMDEKKSSGSVIAWETARDEGFLSTRCMRPALRQFNDPRRQAEDLVTPSLCLILHILWYSSLLTMK